MSQKIKQDICIGQNIRRIRCSQECGQTEFAKRLQLNGYDVTRECLVKIESGRQHIPASLLIGIKNTLQTTFDELFQIAERED